MHSQAMMMLYEEHAVILQRIQAFLQLLEAENLSAGKEELSRSINFFRNYGDKYHHQKEEDILFSLLKDRYPALTSIAEALEEHHEMFRGNLQEAEAAMVAADWESARKILRHYLSDLTDHISAEDDELFVAVDEVLSEVEKERLYFSFLDKDAELGEATKKAYEEQARQTA